MKPFEMMVYRTLFLPNANMLFEDEGKHAIGVMDGSLKLLPKTRLRKPLLEIERLGPGGF